MLLVNRGCTTIPTCLLMKGKVTNDAIFQSSKNPVIDLQEWACQRGPSFQRRQAVQQAMMATVVVMRVCRSASAMYSDVILMTSMRATMGIIMTMSLNLKANASHVCLHEGKRKLAQSGVQEWQQRQVRSCLGAANGSKQPGNGTMALRGAPSGPNGLFVGSTVGVKKSSKATGFALPTAVESDVSTQVGVKGVL
jgi:hypothetical protein